MSDENNNEELRPRKMRGVAFPKAKYGVILAIIIIIIAIITPYFALGKTTPRILVGLNSSFLLSSSDIISKEIKMGTAYHSAQIFLV